MKIQPDQTYRVTSDRREPFTIRIESVSATSVVGHCFPGAYRGTIPITSIRGPEDPKGPVFTFTARRYRYAVAQSEMNKHCRVLVDNASMAEPKDWENV